MIRVTCMIEKVQDFLIKLDIKPCMHLEEISIFSLNHVIVRLTKIYEQPPQTSQNSYFQSHFSVLKIGRIFPKKFFYEEYQTRRPTFIKYCF